MGAFLQAIRSLGQHLIQVDVNRGEGHAMRSRWIRATIDLPEYREDTSESWLAFVGDLLRTKCYDFVLPCTDDAILPFVRHRSFFQSLDPNLSKRIAILSDPMFDVCSDKYRSAMLAVASGLSVPEFHELSINDSLLDFIRDNAWEFPFVIKPRCSYDTERRTVKRVYSEKQLHEFITRCTAWESCIVQKNFNGTGIGVYLLAKSGRILAWMAQERLHEPLEGAGSCYRRSIPLPQELLPGIEQAVRSLDYTGVAMFEFKRNSDGQWAFIEINGRLWGSLPLSVAAGCDFPYWLYQMQCENREDFPQQYRIGVYSRKLYGDLHWFFDNLRADRSDATLATRSLGVVLAEWRHWFLGREYWDSFSWRDPVPFFGEVGELVRECYDKLRRRFFPRWKGKRLIKSTMLKRFRDSHSVLVICLGNICRSPFAAACLREKLAGKVEIREGGYYSRMNRSPPEYAHQTAALLGMDLSVHRSRAFSDADLDWADMVICFDEGNYDYLRQRLGGHVEKIWPLGTVLPEKSPWIADPFGTDINGFRNTYAIIQNCCDELILAR